MDKRLPDIIERIKQSKQKTGRMLYEVLNRVNRQKENKMFETIRFNRVLHCQKNSSNKIYIITIEPHVTKNPKEVHVVAQWGSANTNSFRKQVKHECETLEQADNLAAMLAQEKTKKGYVDVSSSSYVGKMTMLDFKDYLISEMSQKEALSTFDVDGSLSFNDNINALGEMSKDVNIKNTANEYSSFYVKCIDNIGLEDYFETNKEYKASKTNEDDMIEVRDDSGNTHECFTDRFQIV